MPCLSHIFGSDVDVITDGNTNTCKILPQSIGGAIPVYTLGLHSNCTTQNAVRLNVTIETTECCNDLRSQIFTKKSNFGCNSMFNSCIVISTSQVDGKKVCSLK